MMMTDEIFEQMITAIKEVVESYGCEVTVAYNHKFGSREFADIQIEPKKEKE